MSQILFEGLIAGLKFHKIKTLVDPIPLGTLLTLEPEPTNAYDDRAIAIKYNNTMLGYVPRVNTEPIHTALDSDEEVECQVVFTDYNKPTPAVVVSIYLT
jgi:hypothetical protein